VVGCWRKWYLNMDGGGVDVVVDRTNMY